MSRKLKIAIIGSRGYPYVYSGYETLVKELSERLVKKGHKVRVYCHKHLFKNRPKNINGIELIYTPSVKSKIFSQLYNSFFSFLHVCFSSIDVVLVVNTANGPYGLMTKIFFKKTCINVDGLEWLRPKWKGIGSLYFKFSSILSTYFFDRIITDSKNMKSIYLKKFNKDSITIAYGSTMTANNQVDFLSKYNLKPNDYYLIVGRLIPDNNSKLIIEGFLKSSSNKKLVIVGDVPYNDIYAENVKQYSSEKIIFTGYIINQDELCSFFKNAFGYIHGHEFGGTNPTMINALSLNCEIMALDTCFNREMLIGREVVFFEKKIISIKNSINQFEKHFDYRRDLNKKYKLPKIYLWETIVNQYEKLFFELKN